MKRNIFVLHVPADDAQPCTIKQVDRSKLEAFQKLVGGYVEQVTVNAYVVAHFNEDGFNVGLPPNRRATMFMASYGALNGGLGYCGDATFLSQDRDSWSSVSAAAVSWVWRHFGIGGELSYADYCNAIGASRGSDS